MTIDVNIFRDYLFDEIFEDLDCISRLGSVVALVQGINVAHQIW